MSEAFAGVICSQHGKVDLTEEQYDQQLGNAWTKWKCPKCGRLAQFDDERFELIHNLADDVDN